MVYPKYSMAVHQLGHLPMNVIDDVDRDVEQSKDVEPADPLQGHDRAGIGKNDGNVDNLLLGYRPPSGSHCFSPITSRPKSGTP